MVAAFNRQYQARQGILVVKLGVADVARDHARHGALQVTMNHPPFEPKEPAMEAATEE